MLLAGQRLLGLINGILAFSKARPGNAAPLKRSIPLREIVNATVDMLTPLRRREGPRFQVDTESEDIRVMADKVMLHRIFENLIRGLLEYAESRVITIDFSARNGYGMVTIAHIGPILTEQFLGELAELYREKNSLSLYQRKTGLHLALTKKLIEALGGTLQIIVDKEIGPIILIQLEQAEEQQKASIESSAPPRSLPKEYSNGEHSAEHPATPKATRSHAEQQSRLGQTELKGNHQQIANVTDAIEAFVPSEKPTSREDFIPQGDGVQDDDPSRYKVLVGEQNSDTQRLVRSLLQPYYDLTIVPDTDALLKQVDESQFDLLLVDVFLPGTSGHTGAGIVRELRRKPTYRRTPVIAVAGGNTGADKTELIDRSGFDGFLRKPFSIVELLDTVETLIDGN